MSQSTLESISKISCHLDLFDYVRDLKDADGSSYGVSTHCYRGKNGNNSIVLCRKDLQKIWIWNDVGSFLEEQCSQNMEKEKTNSDSICFPPSKESVEIVDINGSGIQLKKMSAVAICQDFFVAVGYRELSMKKKSVVFKSIEIKSPRNITTFSQKKNIINIEKFQSLIELRDGVLAIFYLDFGNDTSLHGLTKRNGCYSLVTPELKSIGPSFGLKYRIMDGIDVVNSVVHKDCWYYMAMKPRGLVLVNLFKNEFVNTVYNASDKNIGPYLSSVYEFQPFKALNGEEYIVTAGNFMKYYVHNTQKTNEIIKVVIVMSHESGHLACWRSLMVDNSYFVSGNHDGSVDVYHVGTDGNLNKAIDSVRVHNELGIGFNCVQVVEKKMNSLRLLFNHNTNSKGLSVLTLTNVPFLQSEKNLEDEDLKERLEFLFIGNCENYFFGDEINRYCVSLAHPNFSIMLSKILFF